MISELAPEGLVAAGIILVAFAAGVRRRSPSAWADWLTLRVGRLSFIEVAGAFLIGFGIGQFLAPDVGRPAGPGVVVTRFGPGIFDASRLPLMLGIVAAFIDIALRVDLTDLLFGGRSPNSASRFVGIEARVSEAIPAGGVGRITVRNAAGQLVSVAATAQTDIPAGTTVQITDVRERTFVVSAIAADSAAKAIGS